MNRSIIVGIVMLVGVAFAIFAGFNVAMGEYQTLGTYAATAIALYFLAHGWRNVWWFTALLIFSGVMFVQGFSFTADHLFFMMICLASLLFALTRHKAYIPNEFRTAGQGTTVFLLSILLTYATLHFFINWAVPYSPKDYALKSCLKAYFEILGTMAAFLWMMSGPYVFFMKPSWPKVLIWIIFLTLAANVIYRGTLFAQGYQAVDDLAAPDDATLSSFYVPFINMVAGPYALRQIPPIATALLAMIITAPGWWRDNTMPIRLIAIASIFLCVAGSILSGGRATLAFCFLIFLLCLIVRRRASVLLILTMVAVPFIALINIFSSEINANAPLFIARSLQVVMIEKGDAADSISGSQRVRDMAREAAFIEWQSDPRILLTGRTVYRISGEEAYYMTKTLGDDGFVKNAIQSGRTHNLLTDLLIQYGLIGALLYLGAYLRVAVFFIQLARRIPEGEHREAKALASAMAIYLPLMLVYQVLGGGAMPSIAVLVIGIIRTAMTSQPIVDTNLEAAPSLAFKYSRTVN